MCINLDITNISLDDGESTLILDTIELRASRVDFTLLYVT